MPSLLEALEKKYYGDCQFDNFNDGTTIKTISVATDARGVERSSLSEDDDSGVIGGGGDHNSLFSIFIPRISPLKCVPELLVLNDCDIDCAGDFDKIKDKCQRVRELDLAQNKLKDWNEVFHILKHMPRIEFLNLSKNQLMGPMPDLRCGLASCFTPPPSISNLRSIVLNGTYLDWPCVDMLIEQLPILEEMHLSLNNYSEVLIDLDTNATTATVTDPTTNTTTNAENSEDASPEPDAELKEGQLDERASNPCEPNQNCACEDNHRRFSKKKIFRKRSTPHTALKTLHFTGNPIEHWHEVCRLGRIFPKLENLVLAECPIRSLRHNVAELESEELENKPPPVQGQTQTQTQPQPVEHLGSNKEPQCNNQADYECPYRHFANLRFLNLSCANINTWEDIDQIARFPRLHHVRVKNWPLWDRLECTEHERRQLLIARLPNVSLLNGGGVISADEREDSERAFIRYYMDKPAWERPKRYDELIVKHGQLDPLVDVNLKPDKRVKILLTYKDRTEMKLVDIYRTVADLKVKLEKVVGLAPNKMRLYYVDQDYKEFGPEEMRFPNKLLYSYNIQNGDELIIDEKK